MTNKLLSIIVPTYNVEKYLRDNLESFCIPEVLSFIEVLIINDGSTDGSLNIAEEYAQRFPETFYIVTKVNGGHGSAINSGVEYATGTYFKVVDADDWVEKDAFINLIEFLKNSDADLIYSGFLWVFDKGQEIKEAFERKAEFDKPFEMVEYKKTYLFDDIADKLYIKMHNITIKTEILKKHMIKVDENCYYVDTEYITYPIPYVSTISFLNDFVYMYRIGSLGQSVSLERMRRNQENYDKVIASLLRFYTQLGENIECTEQKKRYVANVIARVAAGKIKILLSFPTSKEIRKELVNFEYELKLRYPEIYGSNLNRAVKILRKTNYLFYYPASVMVKKKYK